MQLHKCVQILALQQLYVVQAGQERQQPAGYDTALCVPT